MSGDASQRGARRGPILVGMRRRVLIVLVVFAATLLATPAWCGRRAERWRGGELAVIEPHADAVAARALALAGDGVDSPGGSRFDGEWALATCMMTGMRGLSPDRAAARSLHSAAPTTRWTG